MALLAIRGDACAVDAVLFDKDGTLVEFDPLWCGWARTVVEDLAGDTPVAASALADAIGLDLARGRHVPEGPLAVGTMHDLAVVLAHRLHVTGLAWGAARDRVRVAIEAAEPALAEHADVRPLPGATRLVRRLGEVGIPGGVVTSDDTPRARTHLEIAGLDLDVVVGADRVADGGKPAPEGVLLACETLDVDPARTVLIGDSEGDLRAARAAGLALAVHLASGSTPAPAGARRVATLEEIRLTPDPEE